MSKCRFLNILFLVLFSLVTLDNFAQNTNNTCDAAIPACPGINYGTNIPSVVNGTYGEAGPDYGCLGSTPNPLWYYIKVETPSDIALNLIQTTEEDYQGEEIDIDFVIWGAFDMPTCGDLLTEGKVVSCSYDPQGSEVMYIPNAEVGKYYMILITNWSDESGYFNWTIDTDDTQGSFDCSILTELLSYACEDSNGNADFSLDDIGQVYVDENYPSGSFTVYTTAEDAEGDTGQNTTGGTVTVNIASPEEFYYVIKDEDGLNKETKTVILTVSDVPDIIQVNYYAECDTDTNGYEVFNLNNILPTILNGETQVNNYFYTSQNAALQGGNNYILNPTGYLTTGITVYLRVESSINAACYVIVPIVLDVTTLEVADTDLEPEAVCDEDHDGVVTFNLPNYLVDLNLDPLYTIGFYETYAAADAGGAGITNVQNYPVAQGTSQTIYARIQTGECYEVKEFTLEVYPTPGISALATYQVCTGGIVELTAQSAAGNTVRWYDAQNSATPVFVGNTYSLGPILMDQVLWVEAASLGGCTSQRVEVTVAVSEKIVPLFGQIPGICQGDTLEELPTTSTNGITGTWTPDPDPTQTTVYTFYPAVGQCAEDGITMTIEVFPIPSIGLPDVIETCFETPITLTLTTTGQTINWYGEQSAQNLIFTGTEFTLELSQTTTYWLEAVGIHCTSALIPVTITVHPLLQLEELSDIVVCEGDPLSYTFTAPAGFDHYHWSNPAGDVVSTTPQVIFTQEGTFTLEAGINGNPCPAYQDIDVRISLTPIITDIQQTDDSFTVYAAGTGPLEYSLDGNLWQSSHTFQNLLPGIYTVYVRELEACSQAEAEIVLIDIPRFFTPNGDGTNDLWIIRGLLSARRPQVYIFDRYGKLLVQILR